MKWRWKILIGIAVVAMIAILGAMGHHFQLKAAVEKYKAELKAKGELRELAEVAPPAVPADKDAAGLFSKIAALLDTNQTVLASNHPSAMCLVAPGKAIISWQQPFIRDGKASNSWSEVEAALSQESDALKMLRQIPDQAVFDFKLDYSQGFSKMKFSPLVPIRKSAQRSEASAINNLRIGNTDAAIKDNEAMLAVAHGLSHDRMVISELVRIAIVQMSVAVTWELLQATNLTGAQLAALQEKWAYLDFLDAYENAILLERAVGFRDLTEMRRSNLQSYLSVMDKVDDMGLWERDHSRLAALKVKYRAFMWRYWWSYPDEMRSLRGMQSLLEAPRAARTNNCWLEAGEHAKKQVATLGITSDEFGFFFEDPSKADFHFLISSSVITLSRVFNKTMKAEVTRQMAVVAIALKRYQLSHGKYPADLNSLVPEFVFSAPLDPVNGQPLRYRLNADGTFLLYSIGEDGVDDGGNPALKHDVTGTKNLWQNSSALDWVWPQPATPAEIQKYYEEQAKKAE